GRGFDHFPFGRDRIPGNGELAYESRTPRRRIRSACRTKTGTRKGGPVANGANSMHAPSRWIECHRSQATPGPRRVPIVRPTPVPAQMRPELSVSGLRTRFPETSYWAEAALALPWRAP